MIKNRLAGILGERGLKITRVAKDTGISRNTITATAQNDSEMIRLETVNKLCKYLGITPSDFFKFEPLDITFALEIVSMPFKIENTQNRRVLRCESIEADLFMDIDWGHKKESIDLTCTLESDFSFKDNLPIQESNKNIVINLRVEFDEKEERDFFLNEVYNKIDGSFYQDIYHSLVNTIIEGVHNRIKANVEQYIKEYLDPEAFPDGMSDAIFAEYLNHSVENNLDFNILTDDFLPF